MDDLARAAADFAAVRGRLFGIAYRMLGSAADAEDIVQEAWVRWQGADRGAVREVPAFLATMTTRLAINAATSARARRETYVGPWLPEPVATEADPALGAERAEALSFAILLLLEKLSPTERAAYVLREAFDYEYAAIAEIIEATEASARQLVSRARKHIASGRRRPASAAQQRHLLDAFLAAAQAGDIARLETLFAEDVLSLSDGGGVAPLAARIPVAGRERVAKFVAAFSSHFWSETRIEWIAANGSPAAVIRGSDGILAVLSLDADDAGDRIESLRWAMNPDKLARI